MHSAHIGGDGHFIVIENHHEILPLVADMVHGLEGHAAGHGAVADHRHHFVGLLLQVPGAGKAHSRR
ncbi:hypothetical protein D3C75_1110260 [compost metagenome]